MATITAKGTKLVVCMKRGGFTYGGQTLDFGDVTELQGMPNDTKLFSVGYFEDYNPVDHGGLTMVDGSDPKDLLEPLQNGQIFVAEVNAK